MENTSKWSWLTGPVSVPIQVSYDVHKHMRLQKEIFDPIIFIATEVYSVLGSLCNIFYISQ